jgi:hypothetical protein
MNREFWKDFHKWLEGASIGQIFAARDKAYEMRRTLKDKDTRGDVRRMIRLMDHELLARSELAVLIRGDRRSRFPGRGPGAQ